MRCSHGKGEAGAEKVKSPITGRLINVGGPAFQKILDLGYVLKDGQLIHRNCFPGVSDEGAAPQPGGAGGTPPSADTSATAAAAAASDAKLQAVFDRLQVGNGKVRPVKPRKGVCESGRVRRCARAQERACASPGQRGTQRRRDAAGADTKTDRDRRRGVDAHRDARGQRAERERERERERGV